MAKVKLPLLSDEASGTIGKSITFTNWRGIKVVRVWTKPVDANSQAQKETRGYFRLAAAAWKLLTSQNKQAWVAVAVGQSYTGYNRFVGQYVRWMGLSGGDEPEAPFLPSTPDPTP